MTDELGRIVARTQPRFGSEPDWAESEAGARTLESVRRRVAQPVVRATGRRAGWRSLPRLGLIAAVVVVGAVAVPAGQNARDIGVPGVPAGTDDAAPPRQGPSAVALAAYDSCDDLLDGLRDHFAASVAEQGWPMSSWPDYPVTEEGLAAERTEAAGADPGPTFSTTNVQDPDVDEPDLVKTDGRRVVTVAGSALTVVDVPTRAVTGRLQLDSGSGVAGVATGLLLSADRALVIVQGESATEVTLVDLAGTPRVLGSITPTGAFLDARMVGTHVRMVVRSHPEIMQVSIGEQTEEHSRQIIRSAGLSAWLPKYEVNGPGRRAEVRTVPCDRISHPDAYTGASLLSVYSVDIAGEVSDVDPMALVADGSTVYSTSRSLYVASAPGQFLDCADCEWAGRSERRVMRSDDVTEIHRFDITAPGAPRYLGSGSVPGHLLSSYSLSDQDGYLRVATTTGDGGSESAVRVLDQDTLVQVGLVDGLGPSEDIVGVRFVGDRAYVVTFQQTDPLYVVDLSTPTAPRKSGELKITGFSSYLHDVGDGHLLGVGNSATRTGATTGMQLTLFDVAGTGDPTVIDRIVRPGRQFPDDVDPHSVLYWPATGTAVVPLPFPRAGGPSALVLTVSPSGLQERGGLTLPETVSGAVDRSGRSTAIQRTLVIGDDLWSYADSGLLVSDLASLDRVAWIPLR